MKKTKEPYILMSSCFSERFKKCEKCHFLICSCSPIKTPSASGDCLDSAAERKVEDHLESPLPDCNSDQDL